MTSHAYRKSVRKYASYAFQLHAGQGIYANLGAKQISLDGKSPAGTIVNIAKPR